MNFTLHDRHPLVITYKWARRIVITIVGFTVLAVGLAMVVLPGPAFVVIPVGLGILSLEFAWARHWLHKVRERSTAMVETLRSNGIRRRWNPFTRER
jgi:tellurite resistance protein TerC